MYAKLFASLYQGTLRGCSHEILVFTNMIAHADSHGYVDRHWRAIAEEIGLTVEQVQEAVTKLEAPDPESRSSESEGRRLLRLDDHRAWGWKIVNYGKYRSIRNEDDRREQNRIAQAKFRAKSKQNKPRKPISAQAEAEAEALKETAGTASRSRGSRLPPDWQLDEALTAFCQKVRPDLDPATTAARFRDYWHAIPGTKGCKLDWPATWRNWVRNEKRLAGSAPITAPAKTMHCGNCRDKLVGGYTASPKGPVCNPCWKSYLDGDWRQVAA